MVMSKTQLKYEEVLSRFGLFNQWGLLLYIVIGLSFGFTAGWHGLAITFIGRYTLLLMGLFLVIAVSLCLSCNISQKAQLVGNPFGL